MSARFKLGVVALVIMAGLDGCTSPPPAFVVPEARRKQIDTNWPKLRAGMTVAEVERLLAPIRDEYQKRSMASTDAMLRKNPHLDVQSTTRIFSPDRLFDLTFFWANGWKLARWRR